jgi:hypothetical protein
LGATVLQFLGEEFRREFVTDTFFPVAKWAVLCWFVPFFLFQLPTRGLALDSHFHHTFFEEPPEKSDGVTIHIVFLA